MTGIDVWRSLPERVFISHSYADQGAVSDLKRRLPAHVDPVIFPRVDPNPEQAVSNGIVPVILNCPALIYLTGGKSEDSLWVHFERDYGLRSGRRVLSFDPEEGVLEETDATPLPLRVQMFVGYEDEQRAARLLKWMRSERSFEFDSEPMHIRIKEIPLTVWELLEYQQLAVWLMGAGNIGGVAKMAYQVPTEMLADTCDWDHEPEAFEGYGDWLIRNSMYVRLSPDWVPVTSDDPDVREVIDDEFPVDTLFRHGWGVDLVSRKDETKIDWNRADDLIVRLTFMAQQSRPFFNDRGEESEDPGG